jgi:hypothetical protein
LKFPVGAGAYSLPVYSTSGFVVGRQILVDYGAINLQEVAFVSAVIGDVSTASAMENGTTTTAPANYQISLASALKYSHPMGAHIIMPKAGTETAAMHAGLGRGTTTPAATVTPVAGAVTKTPVAGAATTTPIGQTPKPPGVGWFRWPFSQHYSQSRHAVTNGAEMRPQLSNLGWVALGVGCIFGIVMVKRMRGRGRAQTRSFEPVGQDYEAAKVMVVEPMDESSEACEEGYAKAPLLQDEYLE